MKLTPSLLFSPRPAPFTANVPKLKLALPARPTVPISPSVHPLGNGVTAKLIPLLAWPDTVTTTFPVVAPLGTVATIPVKLHVDTEAEVPLKVTALPPCDDPKSVPVMITEVPIAPEVGDKLVMAGAVALDLAAKRTRS